MTSTSYYDPTSRHARGRPTYNDIGLPAAGMWYGLIRIRSYDIQFDIRYAWILEQTQVVSDIPQLTVGSRIVRQCSFLIPVLTFGSDYVLSATKIFYGFKFLRFTIYRYPISETDPICHPKHNQFKHTSITPLLIIIIINYIEQFDNLFLFIYIQHISI